MGFGRNGLFTTVIMELTRNALTMRFMKVLILFVPAAVTGGLAQQVTVHVVNGKSGRPLRDERVVVQFFGAQSSSSPKTLQTDVSGEISFVIPNAVPDYVDVRVFLKSEYWHCGCWVYAETKRVGQQGILQSPATKMSEGTHEVAQKPGEVVIVARPFAFGERLLYPFVKQ
jgi:hypothetical protein